MTTIINHNRNTTLEWSVITYWGDFNQLNARINIAQGSALVKKTHYVTQSYLSVHHSSNRKSINQESTLRWLTNG